MLFYPVNPVLVFCVVLIQKLIYTVLLLTILLMTLEMA